MGTKLLRFIDIKEQEQEQESEWGGVLANCFSSAPDGGIAWTTNQVQTISRIPSYEVNTMS